MFKYVYFELFKEITRTSNNTKTLKDTLMVWGNYDYFRAERINPLPHSSKGIFSLQKKYENDLPSVYDGLERYPIFLCAEENTNEKHINIVDEIINLQANAQLEETESGERYVYVLSLLQLDFDCWKSQGGYRRINEILKEITLQINVKEPVQGEMVNVQFFWNLGESDVALIFKTNCFEKTICEIDSIKKAIKALKNYTLIIFPYTYRQINTDRERFKASIINNLNNWLKNRRGKTYSLVSNFVTDGKHQELLTKYSELGPKINLIFGDYDVQVLTDAERIISENLTMTNNDKSYRYSKTSILFPINEMSHTEYKCVDISNNKETDCKKYEEEIKQVANSFDGFLKRIKDSINHIANGKVIVEQLNNAKSTIIDLYNYFVRLDETGYATDVYYSTKPIFAELCNALNYAVRYSDDNYIIDIVAVVNEDVQYLLESIRQFLGIVSLSPRTFSETQGSYMRSANAALKLICAYHTAIRIMHMHTCCKVGNNDSEEYERKECAVLIVPGRNSIVENVTLFQWCNPSHHISIIESNYRSIFDVQKMLFQLAHEVGHFSGNRHRKEREKYFLNAAFRYTLYKEIYEDQFTWIHKNCFNDTIDAFQMNNPDCYSPIIELDELLYNSDSDASAKEIVCKIKNCVEKICLFADACGNEMFENLNDHEYNMKHKLFDASILQDKLFEYGYLKEYIWKAKACFDEWVSGSVPIYSEEYTNYINVYAIEISNVVFEITQAAIRRLFSFDKIPESIRLYIASRGLEMTRQDAIDSQTDSIISITPDMFEENMEYIASVFKDVYSDLYAIFILNLDAERYAQLILTNDINQELYCNELFLMRYYSIMLSKFGFTMDAATNLLHEYLPKSDIDYILRFSQILESFQDIYLVCLQKYVECISFIESNTEDLENVRAFFKNPNDWLFPLWEKGID